MTDLYQEIIIEEFRHPQNQGDLSAADAKWYERNSSCGDEVTVYLKLSADKQVILDCKWTGDGCAISISALSFLSQVIKQTSVAAVLAMTKADIESLLGIEQIAYGREKCLMLGLTAIQHALQHLK